MKNLVVLFLLMAMLTTALIGCSSDTPAPTATPIPPAPKEEAPTATPEPSAPEPEPPTPTPEPPTPTPEPPTPTPEPPTSTPEPPTPTPEPPTPTPVPDTPTPMPEMGLSSSAFAAGGTIPVEYSCFGDNVSPALEWVGITGQAQSLALLVDDPDSEPAGFVHWVIFNIPPTATGLPQGVSAEGTLADGSIQGNNDFAQYGGGTFPGGAPINMVGYDGACPGGEHRYVFMLYALDTTLDLPPESTMDQVTAAMDGHILAQTELIGLFAPP